LFNQYEYENLWEDEKGDFGYLVTQKNRETLLADLEEAIRTETIKINSKRTSSELMTFVVNPQGRAAAEKGHHDDLVMSLALAIHCYKYLVQTQAIEHISPIPHKDSVPMPSKMYRAQLKSSYGHMTEEDYRWLIK
jgi:hypothetical protein